MKFNKWTLGLAALGVVSLGSVAQAEEQMSDMQASLSSTTISGYVDTSIQWNTGAGNAVGAPVSFQGPGKSDGFNLNVVQLSLAKALDETEWASGYKVDLWFGPDANSLGSQSISAGGSKASAGDLAIRQAYVALRTPVGNGIDWKVGVFDTIIGYETHESGNNPNYTRSYGYTIEPTTHTGLLGTYRLCDAVSVSFGIANTIGPVINERAHGPNAGGLGNTESEANKTYMASLAYTAPESWGWASGSSIYVGVIDGHNSGLNDGQTSFYAGATLATPVTGLKVGVAFDYVQVDDFASDSDSIWSVGTYASYQATEKLSLHGRAEYLVGELPTDDLELFALTGTVQYDLWKNVISRLEVRWDHVANRGDGNFGFGGQTSSGNADTESEEIIFDALDTESSAIGSLLSSTTGSSVPSIGGTGGTKDAVLVALQFIYKF
jgi:hypothetical protein